MERILRRPELAERAPTAVAVVFCDAIAAIGITRLDDLLDVVHEGGSEADDGTFSIARTQLEAFVGRLGTRPEMRPRIAATLAVIIAHGLHTDLDLAGELGVLYGVFTRAIDASLGADVEAIRRSRSHFVSAFGLLTAALPTGSVASLIGPAALSAIAKGALGQGISRVTDGLADLVYPAPSTEGGDPLVDLQATFRAGLVASGRLSPAVIARAELDHYRQGSIIVVPVPGRFHPGLGRIANRRDVEQFNKSLRRALRFDSKAGDAAEAFATGVASDHLRKG
jgi:multisubunit Na+/H+ antiporter MnhG subunit